MTRTGRILVIVVLAVAIGAVIMAKRGNSLSTANTQGPPAHSGAALVAPAPEAAASAKLPRLLDLGANQCIPCKMMAPILDELGKEYAGRLQVDFIDVWQDEAAGEPYRIISIPTQIFFDASGKELYRHEGFISKEDILAQWRQLGVDLSAPK